jgi:hypothetical protein
VRSGYCCEGMACNGAQTGPTWDCHPCCVAGVTCI